MDSASISLSYPPVDRILDALVRVDYKKHLNQYLDAVETILLWVAAIFHVCYARISPVVISVIQKEKVRFYHRLGVPQAEISRKTGISRHKISKMIAV